MLPRGVPLDGLLVPSPRIPPRDPRRARNRYRLGARFVALVSVRGRQIIPSTLSCFVGVGKDVSIDLRRSISKAETIASNASSEAVMESQWCRASDGYRSRQYLILSHGLLFVTAPVKTLG